METRMTETAEVGKVQVWYDWVRIESHPDGEVSYVSHRDQVEGSLLRTIGACRKDECIYIATALSKEDGGSKRIGRAIVYSRLQKTLEQGGDILPDSTGVTMVKDGYMSLLWEDPLVYNHIFGAIPREDVRRVVRNLLS